jgi:hypothetical protein
MRLNAVGTRNGSAVVFPDGDVIAGSCGYWTTVYTVGERGIAVGGGIRFSARRFSTPQIHGWFDTGFVTLECSNPHTKLMPTFTDTVVDGKDGREPLQGLNLFIKVQEEFALNQRSDGRRHISVFVVGTTAIDRVNVIRNNDVVYIHQGEGMEVSFLFGEPQ